MKSEPEDHEAKKQIVKDEEVYIGFYMMVSTNPMTKLFYWS